MDYNYFLSKIGRATEPSGIVELVDISEEEEKTMISLAIGMPNGELFPFISADLKLRNGQTLHLNESQTASALQYGSSKGMPDFVAQLKALLFHYHKPPISNTELCVTNGNSDGLYKAFQLLISPNDTVLVEAPTFAAALDAMRPLGCQIVGIDNDKEGMRTDILKEVLNKWTPDEVNNNSNSNFPKIIYIVPSCGNPTGISMSLTRRIELYKIAHEYNLLILEDDPYYFLQFDEKPLPSFLSMDVDGRVLRFDSFSKIFSAGLRVGYVSGPKELIHKITIIQSISNTHISGFPQLMLSNLINKMGLDNFAIHIKEVVEFYKRQRHYALKAAEKYLTGLAEWIEPSGSMFLWIKILGIRDTKAMIEIRAKNKKVLLVPGCYFFADINEPSSHVRASYSIANEEQLDEAFKRVRDLIIDELKSIN